MPKYTVEAIEQRTPVTDTAPDRETLNKEWALVTEAVRREALLDPDVQATLIDFADKPVGQDTASEMLTELDSSRVNRLARRAGGQLLSFLRLPEVPESLIIPDITKAPRLRSAVADLATYRANGYGEAEQRDYLAVNQEAGAYASGIAEEEREVVSRKYVYARDVKILALGAELAQQGPLELSGQHEITLPSGIHIKVASESSERAEALLNPNKWESRRQIKDRVYEIRAESRCAILKERKTARHVDTREGGHRDGLTAAQEFEVGRQLHETASRREERVKLSWEEPLGYVEYPDGFQFSVFAFEEGLSSSGLSAELQAAIRDNRSEFEEEYKRLAEAAQKYKDHPLVEPVDSIVSTKRTIWQKLTTQKAVDEVFTFEGFARVKARRLLTRAEELYQETLREAGLTNKDMGGFAFRLQSNPVGIEIVGFDYEYFETVTSEQAAMRAQNAARFKEKALYTILPRVAGETGIDQAAYMALMDEEGRLPEAIKNMEKINDSRETR